MSHSFSPHSCRISKSVPPTRAGSLLDSLYQVISQPMLAVQKNCKRSKSLFDIPLQSSLWGLFCGTPLDAMFWLPCVANLPGFSYMLICATSYLSINLGFNRELMRATNLTGMSGNRVLYWVASPMVILPHNCLVDCSPKNMGESGCMSSHAGDQSSLD